MRAKMIIPAFAGGLALGVATLLSAATSTADTPNAPTSSADGLAVATTAPEGTAAAAPEVSERGHVHKDLGEPGGLTDAADGGVIFEISVDSVTVSTTCPGRGVDVAPVNGHFLVLDVAASLSADAADGAAAGEDVFMPLVAEAFDVVAPGGTLQETTVTDASWACFDDGELLPPFLEPGGSVSGKVVLDSASDSGVVVYAPDGEAGWEWEFAG